MMSINITYNRSLRFLMLLFCIGIPWLAFAQKRISGIVVDEKNLPLPGVSVKEKGLKVGVSTDVQGKFSISASSSNPVLVFTFVGFKTKELAVGDKSSVTVKLEEESSQLKDVVVIGYQNIERRKNTGAIASVKGKDFENTPYATIDGMLQGRVPGLTVLSTSGEPGSNNIVSIRGNSSVDVGGRSTPLYVIDGVIYDVNDIQSAYGNSSPLQAINPNDVESVDVLKDASASAIYGARAANGVIIIRTKQAKPGVPQVRVSAYGGISDKPAMKPMLVGTAERRQKMGLLYASGQYARMENLSMMLTDSLNPAFNNNTDWQGLFLQAAPINNIDASIASSTEKFGYRVSFGHYYEEGVMIGYDTRRISPRLNINATPFKNLRFESNLFLGFTKSKHGQGDESKYPFDTWGFPSSFWQITEVEKELYTGRYEDLRDDDRTSSINGNTSVQLTILPELSLKSQLSYNMYNNTRNYFKPSILSGSGRNEAYSWIYQNRRYELENYFNYSKTIKDHSVTALLGQGMEQNNQYDNYTYSVGNKNAIKTPAGVPSGADLFARGAESIRTRLSYFGRVGYDYKSKYLAQLSYRVDGSSRYSKTNRWGAFPAASAAWVPSEEAFFENIKNVVPYLKFRASYGITGLDPGSYYAYYNNLISNAAYTGSVLGNGNGGDAGTYNGTTVMYPDYEQPAADSNLGWERSPQLNIGTDIGLFNNRISLTGDWYVRDSKEKIFDVPVPVTTGYTSVRNNFVSVRNTGFEVAINTRNLSQNSKLQWTTNFNIAYNKNYVTKLPSGGREFRFGPSWMERTLTIGQPLYPFSVWEVGGIYSTNSDVPIDPLTGRRITWLGSSTQFSAGDPARRDVNGDYTIDHLDKVPYGNPNPDLTGGLNNTLTYKGFSLNFLVTFISGRSLWNGYLSDKMQDAGTSDPYALWGPRSGPSSDFNMSDFWQKPGDVARYPGLITNTVDKWHIAQSFYVEDASFIRLKNIRMGYAIPSKLTKRFGVKSMNIYGILDNVRVWSNATVPDPEAVGVDGYSSGNDYPIPKKYTFGLDITL
ncbi:SusC/RagA family TonB-linked outer membrane protein [Desertivirga arenae]|uniref:SusC/RagA family TonB-linked outer membrane protein n=1 Tax=Desertivirga arenae TaxID=2810309 RepID=UPI001A977B9C|nr:TonB-dependent receptor [Pedobacter sp. SYSU D00823]